MAQPKMPETTSVCGSEASSGESVSTAPERAALNGRQLHALFDILTHYQTYAEVERFKFPDTIAQYGYPFGTKTDSGELSYSSVSSAPLLASSLFRNVVLPMPGMRDLPPDFWGVRFQGILSTLGEARLSESYEKGALGTRKTLATAASVIHESVSRGCLGGVPRSAPRNLDGPYDGTKASEVVRGWEDAIHELVYGSMIDELYDCATEKRNLHEHSAATQAALEYILVHTATFIHHILVLSPEGPYLLKLVENVHRMIPYSVVKQTLRIGNAATMINGLLRLFLAKMSVGAMSNWLGITQNADDGMNLLQRILSLVLSWDSSDFRKSAEKIEKAKGGPSKQHLDALKQFVNQPRDEHEAVRAKSAEDKVSIVSAIFDEKHNALTPSLTTEQHAQCLEYYSALLSIRDRDEITKALCAQNPDIFTQSVRDFMACFEPMIRAVHEKVDLREQVGAIETFLDDLINTTRVKKNTSSYSLWRKAETEKPPAPSVEDYVNLLRRHIKPLYHWVHEFRGKCPETSEEFRVWCNDTIKIFQASSPGSLVPLDPAQTPETKDTVNESRHQGDEARAGAAGAMSDKLQEVFSSLPPERQATVLAALEAHARYLLALEDLSMQRMQHVLDNLNATESASGTPPTQAASMSGPGMFLARWQALLNETLITPGPAGGSVRKGMDVKGSTALGKTGAVSAKDYWDAAALAAQAEQDVPPPPDVQAVIAALHQDFEAILVEMART